MKIRWSSLFFASFTHHFQIKLNTYESNLNSIFVIMSELKFFLLTGVLTQNFNTMDLVKFLEFLKKNFIFRLQHHIEGDIMQAKKKSEKK
jgi:hypothetical protein